MNHSNAFCREAIHILDRFGVETKAIAVFMACEIRSVHHVLNYWPSESNFKDNTRSGRPCLYRKETELKVIAFYCQTQPLPGCGRWSLRWAAKYLKANPDVIGATPCKSTIHQILKSNALKPHLSKYFLHITDPDFFPKLEHLLALYLNPPKYLFFFDECPGIQILKRISPDIRDEKMMKRLEEFEYIRNGTTDVFAFLNHAEGTVFAECHSNHTTDTFLQVFRCHVAKLPETEEIHYVMDNLSTHNGYPFCQLVAELSNIDCPSEKVLNTRIKRVEGLKSPKKRIVIHYTPFHGYWLNLIEIWFGIMGKKVLNESFGSPEELKAAFDSFVIQWNLLLAHPFQWKYTGEGLHEKAVTRIIKMLRYSADKIDIRFLTKSLKLMSNLFKNYYSKIPVNIWDEFDEVFWSQFQFLVE